MLVMFSVQFKCKKKIEVEYLKKVSCNNINYEHKLNKPVKYVCITNNDWLIAYRIYKRNIE